MMHGNPAGNYDTPEWIDALVAYILNEMERIVWNNQQREWDRYYDPELPGVQFRPYYWETMKKKLPCLISSSTSLSKTSGGINIPAEACHSLSNLLTKSGCSGSIRL